MARAQCIDCTGGKAKWKAGQRKNDQVESVTFNVTAICGGGGGPADGSLACQRPGSLELVPEAGELAIALEAGLPVRYMTILKLPDHEAR